MNDASDQSPRRNKGQEFAKASWGSFVLAAFVIAFGTSTGKSALPFTFVGLGLMVVGLGVGIAALVNLSKYGREGVLVPALIGVALNVTPFVYSGVLAVTSTSWQARQVAGLYTVDAPDVATTQEVDMGFAERGRAVVDTYKAPSSETEAVIVHFDASTIPDDAKMLEIASTFVQGKLSSKAQGVVDGKPILAIEWKDGPLSGLVTGTHQGRQVVVFMVKWAPASEQSSKDADRFLHSFKLHSRTATRP